MDKIIFIKDTNSFEMEKENLFNIMNKLFESQTYDKVYIVSPKNDKLFAYFAKYFNKDKKEDRYIQIYCYSQDCWESQLGKDEDVLFNNLADDFNMDDNVDIIFDSNYAELCHKLKEYINAKVNIRVFPQNN